MKPSFFDHLSGALEIPGPLVDNLLPSFATDVVMICFSSPWIFSRAMIIRSLVGKFSNIATHLLRRHSSISAVPVSAVVELRKWTGASIQQCKNALEISQCDIQKAVDVLRRRGEYISGGNAKSHSAGVKIAAGISPDFKLGVLSKTTSLTDFASHSELFVRFSEALNRTLLQGEGIPLDKLSFISKVSPQIHSDSLPDVLSEMSSILNEPIAVPRVQFLNGDFVSMYVHNKSQYSETVGCAASVVSFSVEGVSGGKQPRLLQLGDRVARQIIATSPSYIDFSEVPPHILEDKLRAFSSRIENPEKASKAFEGYVEKFKSENCLLDMEWIIPFGNEKDSLVRTVKEVLQAESEAMGVRQLRVLQFGVLK